MTLGMDADIVERGKGHGRWGQRGDEARAKEVDEVTPEVRAQLPFQGQSKEDVLDGKFVVRHCEVCDAEIKVHRAIWRKCDRIRVGRWCRKHWVIEATKEGILPSRKGKRYGDGKSWAMRRIVNEMVFEAKAMRWPPFNSSHEGFAILLEGVERLKAEVFEQEQSGEHMRAEAILVGATAIRFIKDLLEEK